jgi:hypothetical protein
MDNQPNSEDSQNSDAQASTAKDNTGNAATQPPLGQEYKIDKTTERRMLKDIANLASPDWEVRQLAVLRLAERGDARVVEPLIQMLNDPVIEVRQYVPSALGRIGDTRAIGPLISLLKDSEGNVADALKQFGKLAVPTLIEALKNPNPTTRGIVANLLGNLHDERALPALTEIYQNDTSVDRHNRAVKDVAAQAMRSINPQLVRQNSKNTAKHNLSPLEPDESKFDWEPLLHEWSAALLTSNNLVEEPPQEAIEEVWLGYKGATEQQMTELETRLGTRLPPSYRSFLKVSNGWRDITSFIYKLWSSEEVKWFAVRNQQWVDGYADYSLSAEEYEEYLVYGENQNTLLVPPEYIAACLEISDLGDAAIFLLNPLVVTPEGEWEAWFLASWIPGAYRYPAFWEMMQAQYKDFLYIEANRG